MPRLLFVLAAIAFAACSTRAADDRGRYPLLKECDVGPSKRPALCGSVEVPENREQPGRTISLNIVVLPATGAAPKADPLLPVQGGPGQAATPLHGLYVSLFGGLRAERDIVLVDVRGTGRSNPLPCDAMSPEWLRSGDLMPIPLVRACRTSLEARADLRHYTTAIIARDLDDVRKALGIEQWNLYGTSYGTRLAQEYTRLYPAHVRTMTLQGVAGPSMAIPFPYARDSQDAFDKLLDAQTRALLPGVLARLQEQPASVATEVGEIVISAGVFAEALRNLMYDWGAGARAAAMIRGASNGDFTAAATAVRRQRRGFTTDIAMGMFLSVTCTEDIPRIDESQIADATRGTFLGDYRVRQQMAACGEWTRGAPNAVGTPLVSDVPTLLVSGELDPVTPPRLGEEVLRGLSNGVHVTLPDEAHGFGKESGCIAESMKRLIDTGSTKNLAIPCAGKISRR